MIQHLLAPIPVKPPTVWEKYTPVRKFMLSVEEVVKAL